MLPRTDGIFSGQEDANPTGVFGLMLLVSGPDGACLVQGEEAQPAPILDANGWAINARARIIFHPGRLSTGWPACRRAQIARLVDPFADKRIVSPYYLMIALGVCTLVALWYFSYVGQQK